jgi:hypothetical protein
MITRATTLAYIDVVYIFSYKTYFFYFCSSVSFEMIRVKGGQNKEANYMSNIMTQALGAGGGAGGNKKKLWGQDNWLVDKPKHKSKTVRGTGESGELTEVHDVYRKFDGVVDAKQELKATKDDSDDDFFCDDEESELDRIRAARLNQLQKQGGIIQKFKNLGHGRYNHISEDEFLPCVTESTYAVVHFYHQVRRTSAHTHEHVYIPLPY